MNAISYGILILNTLSFLLIYIKTFHLGLLIHKYARNNLSFLIVGDLIWNFKVILPVVLAH